MASARGPWVARVARMRSTSRVKARSQPIGSKGWSVRARHRGVVSRLRCRVSPTVAPFTHTCPRDEGWWRSPRAVHWPSGSGPPGAAAAAAGGLSSRPQPTPQ